MCGTLSPRTGSLAKKVTASVPVIGALIRGRGIENRSSSLVVIFIAAPSFLWLWPICCSPSPVSHCTSSSSTSHAACNLILVVVSRPSGQEEVMAEEKTQQHVSTFKLSGKVMFDSIMTQSAWCGALQRRRRTTTSQVD